MSLHVVLTPRVVQIGFALDDDLVDVILRKITCT